MDGEYRATNLRFNRTFLIRVHSRQIPGHSAFALLGNWSQGADNKLVNSIVFCAYFKSMFLFWTFLEPRNPFVAEF